MYIACKNKLELFHVDPLLEKCSIEYGIKKDGDSTAPLTLEYEKGRATAVFEFCSITDEFSLNGRVLRIDRTWILERNAAWNLETDLNIRMDGAEFFIPSVLYRGNNRGKGCFPKGSEAAGWAYSEERTPLPCCLVVYNDHEKLVFFTGPATEEHDTAGRSVVSKEGLIKIRTVVPGSEGPFSYTGKKALSSGHNAGSFTVCSPEKGLPYIYSRSFYLVFPEEKSDIFAAYRECLEYSDVFFNPVRSTACGMQWSAYLDGKIRNLLYLTEYDKRSGLAYVRMGRDNGPLQEIYEYTAASFLVKSLEGAWIYARLAGRMNRPEFLSCAEGIGRFFLRGEVLPGVHQDCRDLRNGEWGGYLGISENDEYRNLVNARCNGESMSGYIKLYESLLKQGRSVPEFLQLPLRVADFYIDNQLRGDSDGSFGRWWSTDGKPVNPLGTNGAYIVSFLLLLEPYYKDSQRLNDAVDRAARYYAGLADSGDFFGDTLDADAYDKESGVSLLSMFLDLYERDGARKWLDYAVKAADYILTWVWQYDIVFPAGTPLAEAEFRTTGMTSVSVAHHHLDFYGMSIGYDFLRLWEASGTDIYRKNALMMINACRQLAGEGLRGSPAAAGADGWQPEQINHTNWDYFNRVDRSKGFYDICIAWVTVLGLGAWLKIEKRFPEVFRETRED
ncbi:glycoside hydrolase family protein [Sediminispirochaeta smaragdinae]|uniref:Uncharacterized protein n=1 Tax=Sediminispirochaeta smaragdinae (strain DSM 11293 / JCM 15392 / SEBR 4228) TaxID=573413 RepID=E1R181_SEDSS|nr:hypothetical protein [Sediminispirochaeta smaragdinae]ADK80901.1 hypothetical protein Spirs_1775 [Sediminispirochaeta smaragdinae DSM 11293]